MKGFAQPLRRQAAKIRSNSTVKPGSTALVSEPIWVAVSALAAVVVSVVSSVVDN